MRLSQNVIRVQTSGCRQKFGWQLQFPNNLLPPASWYIYLTTIQSVINWLLQLL